MSKVSVSEASKLTGKSIKTIYRHIDTGKLSSSQNENGSKTIDISELNRVYGNLKLYNENVKNSQMSSIENQTDNQINELLQQENEMLKKLLNEKESHINSLKHAMLLLEHKEQKQDKPLNWFLRLIGR